MGTTTNHSLRYPENVNSVAVPADIKKLADDVDAKMISSAGGTVSGNVAFTGITTVQTPTANNHATTKQYVDTADALKANITYVDSQDALKVDKAGIGNLLTLNQATCGGGSGDATGWGVQGTGATVALTGIYYTEGSTSLNVVTDGGSTYQGAITTIPFTVVAGDTYTASAFIRVSSGTSNLRLFIFGSGNNLYSVAEGVPVASGAWRRIQFTFTATATGPVNFGVDTGSGAQATTFQIDKVSVHRGAAGVWSPPGLPIVGQAHIAVNGATHLSGTGTPEGVVAAAPGSTWLQTDATNDVKGWIRWVKATGTGNTGWVAGPEYDSGWRDVTATGWSNVTVNRFQVRRRGNTVEFRLSWNAASNATGTGSWTAPVGFRYAPSLTDANHTWFNTGTATPVGGLATSSGVDVLLVPVANGNVRGYFAYGTSDAIPASLPGTPA